MLSTSPSSQQYIVLDCHSLCALACLITVRVSSVATVLWLNCQCQYDQYATMPNNFIFIAFYFVLPKRKYYLLHSTLEVLNWAVSIPELAARHAQRTGSPEKHEQWGHGLDTAHRHLQFDAHVVRRSIRLQPRSEQTRWRGQSILGHYGVSDPGCEYS